MAVPTPQQTARKSKWFGVGLIVTGIGMVIEALDAHRTGAVIHTLRHTSMEWWEQIVLAAGAIILGILLLASGFGWIKSRNERP
ncbi:MAG: hypothetical protein ABI995_15265 [Acidobacteriota bacterium]